MIACGYISYLGPFNMKYRNKIVKEMWIPKIQEKEIFVNENFNLVELFGNPVEIQEWNLCGLPFDSVSTENVIIEKYTDNYPLIIDPQKQFYKFIKNFWKKKSHENRKTFYMTKMKKGVQPMLEMAVRNGEVFILENVGEKIDPLFDSILRRDIIRTGGFDCYTVGTQLIELDPKFNLFLISNLSTPHYTPELLAKVVLLDFTITLEGLREQMLSLVCRIEEPKDEDEKVKIMIENTENKAKQKQIEQKI